MIAPQSRATVYLNGELGNIGGVASTFTSDSLPFLAERSIYWGAGRVEGTNVIGASSAANEWHFPEGASGGLFDTYLLLANPGANDTTVRLTLFIEGVGRFTASQAELLKTVRAGSRVTIYMNEFLSALETAEGRAGRQPARQVVQHQDRGADAAIRWSRKKRSTGTGTAPTSGAAGWPPSASRSSSSGGGASRRRRSRSPPGPCSRDFPTVLSPATDSRTVRRRLDRPRICRSK